MGKFARVVARGSQVYSELQVVQPSLINIYIN